MEKIKVEIEPKNEEYEILIGESLAPSLIDIVKNKFHDHKIVVITEDSVKTKCSSFLNALSSLSPLVISIPPGEKSKSREKKDEIEKTMFESKLGKDTLVISLGGGVICDLAGFVASTFNRGIPIIHVPTTLLAMCDASIGGKTGINNSFGKNLIGTIYQPEAIIISLDILDTLPEVEFKNGLAEIIKIACVLDKELFIFLEKNIQKIKNRDKDTTEYIIKRAIELKKEIVEKDIHENGLRQVLNFGHTIGHGIESLSSFKIKHGFCVSIGMAVESSIAVMENKLDGNEQKIIVALLTAFGLPTQIPNDISTENILEKMILDKKTKSNIPRFVMIKSIGKTKSEKKIFSFPADQENIRKAIGECR
jgi:3-dehydroquinate synthase